MLQDYKTIIMNLFHTFLYRNQTVYEHRHDVKFHRKCRVVLVLVRSSIYYITSLYHYVWLHNIVYRYVNTKYALYVVVQYGRTVSYLVTYVKRKT